MTAIDLTPYQILNVSEDIDFNELREVYKRKIHEHLQQKISAIKYRRICRAYETLSNSDKRDRYKDEKIWISELSIDQYTPQQLASEPDLIRDLKKRLENANLTEINAQDPITGHTALYCAARAGNIEAVKFLTEHGADPDLKQRTKSTALHAASYFGHANIVQCLLESGADYRIINAHRITAEEDADENDVNVKQIFFEMKKNIYVKVAADELEWLKENGLTHHQDTEYFSQRQTLLHCASKKGYFDMVRWLIENCSANIDLVDFNGNSALHLACYGGKRIIVDYLLEHGCDSTLKNRWGTTAEDEGNKHGRHITDLFKHMRERDMFKMARDGMDWWFYYYFNSTLKDMIDSNGVSLLYYASRYGQYSVVKWLLEHGANINIQMINEPKSTPLHGAKYRGHWQILELLLEYGADVNIQNQYGTTVLTEEIHKDVDENSIKKIHELLLQYKCNLKNEKLLDIYVYDDEGNSQLPIAKIKLGIDANYNDLLAALSSITGNQYQYFSVARRVLNFTREDPGIISAVCRARYASSKFVDTPLHLVCHKILPKEYQNRSSSYMIPKFEGRKILKHSQFDSFSLKLPFTEKKSFNIENLIFTFSENCTINDIKFMVTVIFSPDREIFDSPECICLFRVELDKDVSNLIELPTVSIVNKPDARLYTLATSTSYWFTSNTRKTRLPMIGGIYAFIHHIDIIPIHLTLPADMLLANSLQKPLESQTKPIECRRLSLREQNKNLFPHIAYHGTNIKAIPSILLDGLVIPGTVVSCGIRVTPPKNHFSREDKHFGVSNFADAIFLSPSIHYSSDPVYATTFTTDDQQLIPVIECSVKNGSYTTYPCTVNEYKKHSNEDLNKIEWRVKDPSDIEINAVLFITKISSIIASKEERMKKTT